MTTFFRSLEKTIARPAKRSETGRVSDFKSETHAAQSHSATSASFLAQINLFPESDKTATNILQEEVETENLPENSATEKVIKEVETKNSVDNPSQVVTPVTSQSQQGIEAVNPVVPQAVPEVVTTIVDWKTYPYNSGDRYTLEKRANKVKQRVLSCSTNNDLIKLLANNKASEPEIEWLVQNYLSKTERKQLEIVYKSTQGNLFNQTEQEVEIIEYTISEVINAIDKEMERVGGSVAKTFNGQSNSVNY